jgi:hypothetical protein
MSEGIAELLDSLKAFYYPDPEDEWKLLDRLYAIFLGVRGGRVNGEPDFDPARAAYVKRRGVQALDALAATVARVRAEKGPPRDR